MKERGFVLDKTFVEECLKKRVSKKMAEYLENTFWSWEYDSIIDKAAGWVTGDCVHPDVIDVCEIEDDLLEEFVALGLLSQEELNGFLRDAESV